MKVKEILAGWLARTELFEMAFSRKDAWRKITGLVTPLSLHIAKILLMPNSQCISHWKQEIGVWLIDMEEIVLKPQNRRLSFEEYREWIIREPEHTIPRLLKHLHRQYPSETIIPSETAEVDFQHILLNICHDLANDDIKNVDDYFK